MKHRDDVIFLIDSGTFDRNMFGLTLERITKCKVFNFFSLDECSLYTRLNPKLLIYSSLDPVPEKYHNIKQQLGEHVNVINIAKDIKDLTEVADIGKLKTVNLAQEVASIVNNSALNTVEI